MIKSVTKLFTVTIALTIGGLLFSACSDDNSPNPQNLTIAQTVQKQGSLSTLSDLFTETGLTDTLSQDGPLTLFAPTDEALSSTDFSDDSTKKSILKYHIVDMNLTYENLLEEGSTTVTTLNGEKISIDTKGDSVIINNGQAVITAKGREAANGTIFTIDTLLSAPSK
jgi:uncharacterized surface protein with fasciclin (FAS1) repeats